MERPDWIDELLPELPDAADGRPDEFPIEPEPDPLSDDGVAGEQARLVLDELFRADAPLVLTGGDVQAETASAGGQQAGSTSTARPGDDALLLAGGPVALALGPCVPMTVTTADDEAYNGGSLAGENADGNGLSLREAIALANLNADADMISFAAGLGTLTLTLGDLLINQDLTVDGDTDGDDKADITISGNDASRIINIYNGATVELESLTLTNGYSSEDGGAIYAGSGTTLTITDSTVQNSSTDSAGGGLYSYNSSLTVANSTFTGNTAVSNGGAIHAYSASGAASLTNITVHDNESGGYGGGIVSVDGPLSLNNSTITGNRSGKEGGGLEVFDGTITINNTVIAGNTGSYNTAPVADDFFDNGLSTTVNVSNSFFGTDEQAAFDSNVNNINAGDDPLLGALADNGGTVMTQAILVGSQLIDAGDAALLPADTADLDGDGNTAEDLPIDADGGVRVNGLLDIGAVESTAPVVVSTLTDEDDGDFSDGDLSLREALQVVADGGTITFDAGLAGGEINLQSVLTIAQGTVTIDGDISGDGDPDITITGDANNNNSIDTGDTSILLIHGAADVTLKSLTLSGGYGEGYTGPFSNGGNAAGAIANYGTLAVNYSVIAGNLAVGGAGYDGLPYTYVSGYDGGAAAGGILNGGDLTVSTTVFDSNTGTGGTGGYGSSGLNFGEDGGDGGDAAGAILNLASGTMTLAATALNDGTAYGGSGGNGGSAYGTYYGPYGPGYFGGNGGDGGDGADGILNLGAYAGTFGSYVPGQANPGLGGSGGSGYDGNGSNGSPGVTGSPNLDSGSGALSVVNVGSQYGDAVAVAPGTVFYGLGGADVLTGSAGSALYGGANDDTLIASSGAEHLDGGLGTDVVDYSNSVFGVTVRLWNGTGMGGHAAGDTLFSVENVNGSDKGDLLAGDAAANRLDGGKANDTLNAGGGNDVLIGGTGKDVLLGGDGTDTADYRDSGAAVQVRLWNGTGIGGEAQGDTLDSIENVVGSIKGDLLAGDAGANRLDGRNSGDTINAGAGNDVLIGGGGIDLLIGGKGADVMFGGNGIDTADYTNSGAGVTVRLWNGTGTGGEAEGDTLDGIENVTGSAKGDVLAGDSAANVLNGLQGNDTLNAGGGGDTLIGGTGMDILLGGNGTDTADYRDSGAAVEVRLWNGTGIGGQAQGDTLDSIENVVGSAKGDLLAGDSAANRFDGRGGADTINAGSGGDTLIGGGGNDTLIGGNGNDTHIGGNGNDTFVFADGSGVNTITDFNANDAEDIDLSAVTAITGFNDLVNNHLVDNGGTAQIVDGANSILLTGVTVAEIGVGLAYSEDDFIF